MSNHQILDNINHNDIRIVTEQGIHLGDDESYAILTRQEIAQSQPHYPIFLRKNSRTGQFELIALFGFTAQENLYLDENGWHAPYIPLSIQRRPFLIGFKTNVENGISEKNPIVHIDMDNPRVNKKQGEAIFLETGEPSPYLENISAILSTIHHGHIETSPFVDALLNNDLIESVNIKIKLNDDSNIELVELYTIHEENVAKLRNETLTDLHQLGYLKDIHLISASLSNLSSLIDTKNKAL